MKKIFYCLYFVCILVPLNSLAYKPKVIAYYTGDAPTLKSYNLNQISHLIYSFADLRGDSLLLFEERKKIAAQQIIALKKEYPKLRVMISFGGWGACASCSDLFASAKRRATFVQSVHYLLEDYGFDGIDLDWEYPAIEGFPGHTFRAEDKANFTKLVTELRYALGKNKILSFAAGGFIHYLENAVEWDAVSPMVDFINLMTYDLVGGYATVTGHHSPLLSYVPKQESADRCIQWLLQKKVPRNKLIIGAAMYARVWKNVPSDNQGLFQKGVFKEGVRYANFEQYFDPKKGFIYYWDEGAKAPFYYNESQKLFATFDDKRSIQEKVRYMKQQQLGGIMFWELVEDKTNDGLLNEIWNNLGRQ